MINLNGYVSFLVVLLVVLFDLPINIQNYWALMVLQFTLTLYVFILFLACLSPCVLNSILCRCQSCLLTPFKSVDAEATGLTCMQLFYCSIGKFNIPSSLLFTLGNNQYLMHSYITYSTYIVGWCYSLPLHCNNYSNYHNNYNHQ